MVNAIQGPETMQMLYVQMDKSFKVSGHVKIFKGEQDASLNKHLLSSCDIGIDNRFCYFLSSGMDLIKPFAVFEYTGKDRRGKVISGVKEVELSLIRNPNTRSSFFRVIFKGSDSVNLKWSPLLQAYVDGKGNSYSRNEVKDGRLEVPVNR